MSHELTQRASGLVEFAFNQAHGAAWHGLGQPVPADHVHDVDHWRQAAGMDWKVQRSKVRYNATRGAEGDASQWITLDDQHVLFRSDTRAALGIVSDGYKVVQPGQVVEFFRDLVEAGGLELSAMGTLQGGRRFWATARIGEAAPASVRDRIGGYVLLSTSCDGSLATEARLTTIRTVCANTLAMARKEGRAAFKLSHRSVFDPERIKREMGLNLSAWQEFQRNVVRLANKPVVRDQAEDIVAQLLAGSADQAAKDQAREKSRGFDRILSLFSGEGKGAQLDGVYGTAWGLLNAVTEYVDHHAPARTTENRFISSQWGTGNDTKSAAFDLLMAL